MVQGCKANSDESHFVARADDVPGADPHGNLLNVLYVLIKLSQQPCRGVLFKPEKLTAKTRGRFSTAKNIKEFFLFAMNLILKVNHLQCSFY